MTTHEVLVAARNLIDREGWKQDKDFGPGPGHCAYSAMCGLFGPELANEAVDVLVLGYGGRYGGHGTNAGLYRWNDEPERTKEEVLALFDEAIAATAPAPADPFPSEQHETTRMVIA
jgi:hypothetical protein